MSKRRRKGIEARTDPILNPPPPTRAFWREALAAFVYVLQPRGALVVALSTFALMFASLVDLPLKDMLLHPRALILAIVAAAFLIYCFFEVIQNSAGGIGRFPNLFLNTEFDLQDTLLYGIEGTIVSYLPTLGMLVLIAAGASGWLLGLTVFVFLLGCLYLPPALLSLAVWRDMRAVSPEFALPLYARVPGPMLLGALLLLAATALLVAGSSEWARKASFLIAAYGHFAAAYLYFVAARIIGITHWVYRDRIAWFSYRHNVDDTDCQ